jgi:hypothetical protein
MTKHLSKMTFLHGWHEMLVAEVSGMEQQHQVYKCPILIRVSYTQNFLTKFIRIELKDLQMEQ